MDVKYLVEALTGNTAIPLNGNCVFRSFDSIKRLSIVHAGIFKPANHLHRYSRLSGADVTTELTKWKNASRCQKSDFVGIGFRNGFPVSVGASVKGKIWSPEELLKHLERRNGTGVLQGKRFYHGNSGDIDTIKKALKYTDVSFEFAIAQPGVKASSITLDMHNFLGSVYSTVVEMTETKLRCYFNQN